MSRKIKIIMQNNTKFQDLGSMKYKAAWDYQKILFEEVLKVKNLNKELPESEVVESLNYLLFCEHPHVFTIGKSGKDSNLLINRSQLEKYDAELFHTDRGGDITYHGPGQIVGYPILDLQAMKMGIKDYVNNLEEAVIITLKTYGIESGRLKGATGVWLDVNIFGKTRKICAIGVKASHFVTMHGFAFNINTDLKYFNLINPCGFTDKGVTSLSYELSRTVDIEDVKIELKKNLSKVFNFKLS